MNPDLVGFGIISFRYGSRNNERADKFKASHPKFSEILEFTEWVSDQVPHKFRIEGDEIVVDTTV